jgi:hypothetical protein
MAVMSGRGSRAAPWSYAVALASLPLLVSQVTSADPVLHERVLLEAGSGGMRCKGGVCTSVGPSGKPEIRAVEQHGQLLAAPGDGPQPAAGEPVFTPEPEHATPPPPGGPPLPGDPPPERRPMVRMDRETGSEAPVSHTYHSVFTPSEFPYKRMSVLDSATDDEMLRVANPERTMMPRLGAEARAQLHDAFWGSIVVDLEPGRWVPLPSVAADSRLLDWRTEPASPPGSLEFSRDGADNHFVRAAPGKGAGGRRRLIWLVDAPVLYFGGPILDSRLDEIPRALLHPLPPRLQRLAREVLDKIGVRATPHTSIRSILDPLVAHFRAFETGTLPSPTESTYRDLALAKKGVCRHRAFAFVITALAAGLPARYVENELHVFVEVYLPRFGWRRINLGGAALDDKLDGADEKALYQPLPDDLPRPPQFASASTPPTNRGAASSHGGGGGGSGGGGAGIDSTSTRIDLDAILYADKGRHAGGPPRIPTRLDVELAARVAFRGDTVEVGGKVVEGEDAPAVDLPIEIYLDSPMGAERVGQTRSGPDGRFDVVALLPPGISLGSYKVVARTPGDARRAASSSRH